MAGLDINSFPKLKIDSGNVTSSWRSWHTEFSLVCEVTELKMGVDQGGHQRFQGRTKLLALLNAIGKEGRDVLSSKGFDVSDQARTYDEALDLLRGVYEQADSVYVKTMRFVTVSQNCGELETDYLRRVEKHSREVNFGANNDAVRASFAVAIAVNGLRESSLRTTLMQEVNLDWQSLTNAVRARQMAKISEDIISEAKCDSSSTSTKTKIKTEVDAVGSGKTVDRSNLKRNDSYSSDESPRRGRSPSSHRKRYDDSYRSLRRERDSSRSSNDSWGSYSSNESHRRRQSPSRNSSPVWRGRRQSPSRYSRRVCYECKSETHRVKDCPHARCYICNRYGHMRKQCPKRDYRYYDNAGYSPRSRRYGDDRGSPSRHVRFSTDSGK